MTNEQPEIVFPNLGIKFQELKEIAFSLFGIDIYWYAIFIATGILGGWAMASYLAKKTKQDPDIYADFLIWAMISSIVGARLYYVAFSWENYKNDLLSIFNLRQGGLAVYGGVLMAVLALILFTKHKKLNFWILADTASVGIFVGQIFGRVGNFINKEVYGGYTDSLFAMAIKKTSVKGEIPLEVLENVEIINGIEYIQVQPTFLYEMLWNIAALTLVLLYFKKRRFNGEIFALYFLLYGMGRAWIEMVRTDQLLIGDTGIPISVLVSVILVIVSAAFIIIRRKQADANKLPYPNEVVMAMADPEDKTEEKTSENDDVEGEVDAKE